MTLQRVVKETLSAELASVTGGLVAGLGLARMTGQLEAIPGMLVMIPAVLGIRGNIGGSLAARLGSALHMGVIRPELLSDGELARNVAASLILSAFESLLIGVFTLGTSILLGLSVEPLGLVLMSLVAGILSAVLEIPAIVGMAIILFRRGVDPDSVMGPIQSTVGDVVCVLCLFLAAKLVFGGA